MAAKDGRKDLGGDIMITARPDPRAAWRSTTKLPKSCSSAAKVGLPNIKLIIAPTDFRGNGLPAVDPSQPAWLPKLCTEVASGICHKVTPCWFVGRSREQDGRVNGMRIKTKWGKNSVKCPRLLTEEYLSRLVSTG
jgi:hypothetical protein